MVQALIITSLIRYVVVLQPILIQYIFDFKVSFLSPVYFIKEYGIVCSNFIKFVQFNLKIVVTSTI